MFKKIKDFISNHKTALFGVLLVILCLVAVLLPKYLENKRFSTDLDNSGITYTFDDSFDNSEINSISEDTIESDVHIVGELVSVDFNDFEFIYDYALGLEKKYYYGYFNSLPNYLYSRDFSYTENLDIYLDYVLNYLNFKLDSVEDNIIKFSNGSDYFNLNLLVEDNKIKYIDYESSLSNILSPYNVSLLRASNDIYYDCIIYDDLENIYYISLDNNYIITNYTLASDYSHGMLSFEDLVSQSQALGLTYESLTGNKAEVSSMDEAVSENVSSEEVEN